MREEVIMQAVNDIDTIARLTEDLHEQHFTNEPDYWTKLYHQAVIAAMQGICANYNDFTKDNDGSVSNTEMICENAKIIATVLVNKLKNEN